MAEEWYEEKYEVGNIKAVVAIHKNIPVDIQIELNELLLYNYEKFIFNVELFDAAMLLLAGGYLPHQDKISQYHYMRLTGTGMHKYYLHGKSGAHLKEEALTYIADRGPDETVVLVFKDDEIIGTMTLTMYENRAAMTGMEYIKSDIFSGYPDGPGLEIGRLAKGPQKDLLSSAAMTTAFIVTENYFKNYPEVLPGPFNELFVCGETFKHVADGLSLFFPITTLKTTLNWAVLDHPLGMYFLTRDVISSFPSTEYLIQLIEYYKNNNLAGGKIRALIEYGTGKPIEKFVPEKFHIFLFHFNYGDPRTQVGFKEMDKLIKEMVETGK